MEAATGFGSVMAFIHSPRKLPGRTELGEESSFLVLQGLVLEQLAFPATLTLAGPIMTLISVTASTL